MPSKVRTKICVAQMRLVGGGSVEMGPTTCGRESMMNDRHGVRKRQDVFGTWVGSKKWGWGGVGGLSSKQEQS